MQSRPTCRCGHPYTAHEHYRPGTECALCQDGGCARYRPAGVVGALQALPRAVARVFDRGGRGDAGS